MYNLFNKRHSLAHILMMATEKLFPGALATIGPVIENGFYYDIDFSKAQNIEGGKFEEKNLKDLQKEMKKIISSNLDFTREEISESEAREYFGKIKNNKYKLELIDMALAGGNPNLTVYKTGNEKFFWQDLCEGPHISNTKEIAEDSWKLDKIAGAYWRGDEKREQLTRIYGLAFNTKEELENYETQMAEAKKRDHRKLGKELGLFIFSDLVGPGLPLWTPKGTVLRREIDKFVQELRSKYDYGVVAIPHLTKKDLYVKSQHYEKYGDDLFKVQTRDGHELCMKPMNCPHHAQIYASELRSYKELPVRYSETTMVYRDEQSGELNGLSRVLSITQDDAHIFCRESQLEEEMGNIWNLIETFYSTFGFTNLTPRFSRRDDDAKFKGSDETWAKAEGAIKKLLETRAPNIWIDGAGEAAFYGPKIDFMAEDAIGRKHQVGTIQLDFVQPANFGLEYVNEEGKRDMPVMIHCAIAGSLERFLSVYIEHSAGEFPLWLAPVQLSIIPIRDTHDEYAKSVFEKLKANKDYNFRIELCDSKNGLGKNVREAKNNKLPYWIVIGDQEMNENKITLESRNGEKLSLNVDELLEKLKIKIEEKR